MEAGEAIGRMKVLFGLVRNGTLTISMAAEAAAMEPSEFERQITKVFYSCGEKMSAAGRSHPFRLAAVLRRPTVPSDGSRQSFSEPGPQNIIVE